MKNEKGFITNSADKYFNQYTVNRAFIIETVKKYTYQSFVYFVIEDNFGTSEFEKHHFLYGKDELEGISILATGRNYFWLMKDHHHDLMVKLKMFGYREMMLSRRDWIVFATTSSKKIEEAWERDWTILEPLLIEFIDMRAERRNQQILAQKNENNNS